MSENTSPPRWVARQPRRPVRQLPLECLLVETDSPVLGPEPGERNEPANAVLSVREIAGIKGLTAEEVAAAVERNTRRLYGEALGVAVEAMVELAAAEG